MDSAVSQKIQKDLQLTEEQINTYESLFCKTILPVIKKHYLSHLVSTFEELINEKRKQTFLKRIRETIANGNTNLDYDFLVKAVNQKRLRLFSIIFVPVESGKLKARTHFISNDNSVLITYWKGLPESQIRILIAHELGHVANKYLLDSPVSDDKLATLFAYIALQDRNYFYKNEAKDFTRTSDVMIYDEIANICNRKNM